MKSLILPLVVTSEEWEFYCGEERRKERTGFSIEPRSQQVLRHWGLLLELHTPFICSSFLFILRERERERERESMSRGGAEREGDREPQAGSIAVSHGA